jgi:hypothetical protein
MDAKLVKIIETSQSSQNQKFIPSKTFTGNRVGYVFQNGEKGLGYYIDQVSRFVIFIAFIVADLTL